MVKSVENLILWCPWGFKRRRNLENAEGTAALLVKGFGNDLFDGFIERN